MRVENIPIDRVDIGEENVRRDEEFGFDDQDRLLISNLDRMDLLQPVAVRYDEASKRYKLISGRRRLLALKEKGASEIPAVITDLKGAEAEAASLIENIIRKDLSPLEKASKIKKLVEADKRGAAGVSEKYGIPKSNISEWLSILELPDELKLKLHKGEITVSEAVKIARLAPEKQRELASILDTTALQERMIEAGVKRGAPKGLFALRLVFNPKQKRDRWLWESLEKLAREEGVETPQYARNILKKHVEEKLGITRS